MCQLETSEQKSTLTLHPARMVDPEAHAAPILSSTRQGLATRFSQWLHQYTGRYSVVAMIAILAMTAFTLLRAGLLIAFVDLSRLSVSEWAQVVIKGIHFDILATLCFILPQTLHLTFVRDVARLGRINRFLVEIEWVFAFVFLAFLCCAEWLFFAEFESRLNYIAFEYVVYPKEVCCNIWESYRTGQILAWIAVAGVVAWLLCRGTLNAQLRDTWTGRRRWTLMGSVTGSIAALWMTLSMSGAQVTDSRPANECACNGLYSFVAYAWSCRYDFDHFYVTMDPATAADLVRHRIARPASTFVPDSSNPIDRVVRSEQPARNWNVVVILEESLGSDFVGVLGDGRGLTPRLDELSRDALLFDNFFATGNRTARALEAVLTSLPPLPTESILKRDLSDDVYTLANVLEGRGYTRLFMTGGRGLFDGVKSFMTANGFNRFIEQSDFKSPVFTNAWGVSDEDLFRRAIKEFDQMNAKGQPFFSVVLTVSNHRPFTFPANRISDKEQNRDSAVKYADWALGQFFDTAQTRPFYRNTLFVVMGDHGARIYGSQQFPVKSYRIPVVMIRPDQDRHGERCSTLACSLDITPTILGALGGSYRSVFFGHDVLAVDPTDGRVLMQHNRDIALMDSQHRVTMLGAGRTVSGFQFDPVNFQLVASPQPDASMAADTISLFQLTDHLYYSNNCHPDVRQKASLDARSSVSGEPLRLAVGSSRSKAAASLSQ